MDNLISREAVVYYIKSHIQEIISESGIDKNEHTNRVLKAIVNGVETMPSVTQKHIECEDAISREWLLKQVDNLGLAYGVTEETIKQAPSVTPSRRKGHWIYDETLENWRCSKCNETPKTMGYTGTADFMAEHFKFCNHCGAEMGE